MVAKSYAPVCCAVRGCKFTASAKPMHHDKTTTNGAEGGEYLSQKKKSERSHVGGEAGFGWDAEFFADAETVLLHRAVVNMKQVGNLLAGKS